MLVLSRKQGETLQIGDNITVKVLEVHGRVMKIGIEAPANVKILRGELESWKITPIRPLRRRAVALMAAG
jgi:carbon storage regulator CsrA